MTKNRNKSEMKFLFTVLGVKEGEIKFFTSRQFGPYPFEGETKHLMKLNGEPEESGYVTTRVTQIFDGSNKAHHRFIDFLLLHPENVDNGGTGFSMVEVNEQKNAQRKSTLNMAKVIQKIMEANRTKLKAVASFCQLPFNIETEDLRTSLIDFANQKIKRGANDPEPGHLLLERAFNSAKANIFLTINEMLAYKLIKINSNGIYVHGDKTLGLNIESVSHFLETNSDFYSLLKKDLNQAKKSAQDLDLVEESEIVSV